LIIGEVVYAHKIHARPSPHMRFHARWRTWADNTHRPTLLTRGLW